MNKHELWFCIDLMNNRVIGMIEADADYARVMNYWQAIYGNVYLFVKADSWTP